jgi:hypothetical protein
MTDQRLVGANRGCSCREADGGDRRVGVKMDFPGFRGHVKLTASRAQRKTTRGAALP